MTQPLNLDALAVPLLAAVSPSGALAEVANRYANPELDRIQDEFDSIDAAVQKHLAEKTLVQRIEDDFAQASPLVVDAEGALEKVVIPMVSILAGPASPFLSLGLVVACRLALAVYSGWAKRRLGKTATI